VSVADVLHERVLSDDDYSSAVGLESAHRPQALLQLSMIGLDPVVGVLLGVVSGARSQLIEDTRVDRRLVGNDLHWGDLGGIQRPGEEAACRCGVPPLGEVDVDDLAELVYRPVHVTPLTGHTLT
jgi:hypothetical protein